MLTLAVVLPDTGTVIGDVVLKWICGKHRQGEIGYMFHPVFGGKVLNPAQADSCLLVAVENLGQLLHRREQQVGLRHRSGDGAHYQAQPQKAPA